MAIKFIIINLIISLVNGAIIKDSVHKIVLTDKGEVKGYLAEDGDYLSFLGIPYAESPTGTNRFKAPQPVKPWNGTLEATRIVKCAQMGIGEEDCLVVNVFTSLDIKNTSLPVLVFFHGGSFIIGSGYTTGFNPVIEKDVIVVTLNYRLGAFGFLCLGVEDAPGNAGMKDQVLALQWVQNNIKAFGGDSDEVTIYGMSAGSASVEYLLLSNKAKGLFKRVIMESGSAVSVFSTDFDPSATAIKVAIALNFTNPTNINDLISQYRTISANELSSVSFECYINDSNNGNMGFVPCIEEELNNVDPFITESPKEILSKGNFDRVPLLYSYTSAEGLYLNSEKLYEEGFAVKMNENFADFLPYDLIFDTDVIKRRVAENVKSLYFGNDTISEDTKMQFLSFFGDYYILYPTMNSLELHVAKSKLPIYMLEFAYKGNLGGEDAFYDDINLAGHGDVVKHAFLIKPIRNDEDQLAVERVSTIIANFAKSGNPLPTPTENLNVSWPPIRSNTFSYLRIGHDVQILENPYQERINIWDDLYKKYGKPITQADPKRDLMV